MNCCFIFQEQLITKRLEGRLGMIILNPDVPMKCLIKNKLYTLLTSILAVAVGKFLTDSLLNEFSWNIVQSLSYRLFSHPK